MDIDDQWANPHDNKYNDWLGNETSLCPRFLCR